MKNIFKKVLAATSAFISLCATTLTAFAEGEGATASTGNGNPGTSGNNPVSFIIMIAVFFLVGYFFILRPEKKRKKEAETLRNNLRPGNRITTIGGIVGTVEKVTDEEIHLTNGLVLKRWALRNIEDAESSAAVTYYEEDESTSEE